MRYTKCLITVSLIIFLILPVSFSQNNIPAPFEKAKEMAMKSDIDERTGFNVWQAELSMDGTKILYRINYVSEDHPFFQTQIVLKKNQNGTIISIAFLPCEEHKEGHFLKFTLEAGWVEVNEKEGLSLAFQFFRELVSEKLI